MVPSTSRGDVPGQPVGTGCHRISQVRRPFYYLFQVVAIVFFSYFYVSIIFNPSDLAENMRKYGGFIPGIRPVSGRRSTSTAFLTRLTLVGALYLAAVSVLPEFSPHRRPRTDAALDRRSGGGFPHPRQPGLGHTGFGINFYFGGTSLLIVVGVAIGPPSSRSKASS